MLTEAQRGIIVDDVKAFFDQYKYTINSTEFDPDVKVYRHNESFDTENPYVMVQFLPTTRNKFRSLSDVTGIAEGRYMQFSFCQIELCSLHFYCNRMHYNADKTKKVNGRLLCADMAEKLLERINKYWDLLLIQWGACFDNRENLVIKDFSGLNEMHQTKIYNYDIDVYLRTQFKWNKVPEGYDPDEELADNIGIEIENKAVPSQKKKIIIRYV